MKIINKQKFLAELGRLLTFMFEEDRLEALALYDEMFDAAADEQRLLQFLVSPTRQAVVIARAYQSGSGKLQVRSTSRSDSNIDSEGIPSYIIAIDELRHEAELKGIVAANVNADNFSLFEEASADTLDAALAEETAAPVEESEAVEIAEAAEEPTSEEAPEEEIPMHEKLIQQFMIDMPVVEEVPAEVTEEAVPEEAAPEAEAETEESVPAAEEEAEEAKPAEAEEAPEEKAEEVTEEKTEETAEEAMENAKDAVDAFLEDFSIAEEKAELPAQAPAAPVPAPAAKVTEIDPIADDFTGAEKVTVRKARPLLLVLFLIFAIPIGLAGIGILTVPTSVFFSLAVTALTMGAMLITTAFGSLAMFSDMLVVLGGSLVLLALGLLFAWLFIWFIGGAMVGLVRGLCHLARKWCYKEVDA